MDITERKITKIAREVSKFTVRTLRAEGIGPGEFDVLHVIRKNPGITQSGVCRITGFDKVRSRARRRVWRPRATCAGKPALPTAAAAASTPPRRPSG